MCTTSQGFGQQVDKKSIVNGGGNPPTTGMARDYDYLFKLLIIGDSGKRIPGMRNGKWASPGIYTMSRRRVGRGS